MTERQSNKEKEMSAIPESTGEKVVAMIYSNKEKEMSAIPESTGEKVVAMIYESRYNAPIKDAADLLARLEETLQHLNLEIVAGCAVADEAATPITRTNSE
jgi:hypothetical protein